MTVTKGPSVIQTALLAWLTWLAVAGASMGIGLLLPSGLRSGSLPRLRVALWTGLALVVALAMAWNLLLPNGEVSGTVLVAVVIAVGVLGWGLKGRHVGRPANPGLPAVLLVVGLAAASILLSFLALGTPLNYDAGLYHLGAVNYASHYGTVPGLANLHDRFGFNSSVYPISAMLGNGPWDGQGFRLLNGLFLMAMGIDAALRLIERPKGEAYRAGSLVMIGGAGLVWSFVLMVSQDRLVSPTPDTLAMVLVIVATAYLTDSLLRGDESRTEFASVALAVAALSATARPLNWSFWLALVVVTAALVTWRVWGARIRTGFAISIALGVLMAARDTILSGWLLFPLSALPMPVPWRTVAPEASAEWIRVWARYRSGSATDAPLGGDWLGPWLARTVKDWSVLVLVLMLVLWLVLFLLRREGSRQYWAAAPSLAALVLWFTNAPDPRFAWGQILSVGLVPLAVVASPLRRLVDASLVALTGLLALSMAGAFVRGAPQEVAQNAIGWSWQLGPLSVPLAAVPVRDVPVRTATLADGTQVTEPTLTDQCWANFPLCRPAAGAPIRLRGPGVAQGFELVGQ